MSFSKIQYQQQRRCDFNKLEVVLVDHEHRNSRCESVSYDTLFYLEGGIMIRGLLLMLTVIQGIFPVWAQFGMRDRHHRPRANSRHRYPQASIIHGRRGQQRLSTVSTVVLWVTAQSCRLEAACTWAAGVAVEFVRRGCGISVHWFRVLLTVASRYVVHARHAHRVRSVSVPWCRHRLVLLLELTGGNSGVSEVCRSISVGSGRLGDGVWGSSTS